MPTSLRVMLIVGLLCFSSPIALADIISIESPDQSDDAQSYPRDANSWSISVPPYPLDINFGMGQIVNPVHSSGASPVQSDFARHDHFYTSAHVPDPSRAVVTYRFDTPTIVDQVEIIQHRNGITQLEAFVGDTLGTLNSVGSIFGPAGDNTTFNGLTEHGSDVFDFNNTVAGTYLQLVVRKTNAVDGWATYRMFPRTADGMRIAPATEVPEPKTMLLSLLAVGYLAISRRFRWQL